MWLSIIGIFLVWLIGAMFLTQLPVYTENVINGNWHIVILFLILFSIRIGFSAM